MFTTEKEIKEFIEWAKAQGASEVTVKDVSITFNPTLQAIEGIERAENSGELKEISHLNNDTLADSMPEDEDEYEKVLFHSSDS